MRNRKEIHQACLKVVQERIHAIRHAISDAQESANEQTKSSAGDKHETGRAMMQLETENLTEQLEKALADLDKLNNIELEGSFSAVSEGALVETDRLNLYFSVPTGKHKVNGQEFVSLSLGSPLGMEAKGKKKGDTFSFRDITYSIQNIY